MANSIAYQRTTIDMLQDYQTKNEQPRELWLMKCFAYLQQNLFDLNKVNSFL